ncbi:DUF305 domain-containing protein [Roseomonas genomospecies 6]|uniref:DUF305 domain-containing protein n=1 Tax=Roseomonas genomospecies 6 TaxID=214106 RepID=A0A9W7TWP4_9PROT|nr:DUF305 domain-containing protein [Roseomonas genomospecies 6]KAA0679531.1 DUF305 domain-containing protein [Roseomonas genomospecies 6]
MSMKKHALLGSALALVLTLSATPMAMADGGGGGDWHETVVYELELVSGGAADPAVLRADLDYVIGMREHHAGALTMSEEYLAKGRNPVLRRMAGAIIANQEYEIAVLDEVKRQVEQPPKVLVDFGATKLIRRPVATEGLEHQLAYVKAPPPTALDLWTTRGAVDEYDVRWAMAMIAHHQGALDMARAYNADPNGKNSFLREMNYDIVQDQTYEIGLLESVVARYPGDASAIKLDPSMVHGMSMHGGHGTMDHGAMNHGATGHDPMNHKTKAH